MADRTTNAVTGIFGGPGGVGSTSSQPCKPGGTGEVQRGKNAKRNLKSNVTSLADFPCVEAARCYVTDIELGMRISPLQVSRRASSKSPPISSSSVSLMKDFASSLSSLGRRRDSRNTNESCESSDKDGLQRQCANDKNDEAGKLSVSTSQRFMQSSPSNSITFTKHRRTNEEWYISIETSYLPSSQQNLRPRKRQSSHRKYQHPIRVLQLRHCATGQYLCADLNGQVSTCPTANESTRWLMITQAQYEKQLDEEEKDRIDESTSDDGRTPRQRSRTSSSSDWSMASSCSSVISNISSADDDDDESGEYGRHRSRTDYTNNAFSVDSSTCHNEIQHRFLLLSCHTGRRLVYSTDLNPGMASSSSSSITTTISNESSWHQNSFKRFGGQSSDQQLFLSTAGGDKGSDDEKQNDGRHPSSAKAGTTCVFELEFTSGELCFLSNPVVHCQVRCNLAGQLSMVHQFQGWEVFRFIDLAFAGDANERNSTDDVQSGDVAISSWVHHQYFLASNSDGDVFMTSHGNNRSNITERWRLKPSTSSGDGTSPGVFIQSVAHGRYLSVGRHDKEALCTTTKPNDYALWHLDAAHSYVYYLSSLFAPQDLGLVKNSDDQAEEDSNLAKKEPSTITPKSQAKSDSAYSLHGLTSVLESTLSTIIPPELHISSSRRGPFLTKNKRTWEEWRIESVSQNNFDQHVTFFSVAHQKYLGCNSSGQVHTTTSKGPWCTWEMHESPYGGVMFQSVQHNRVLTVSNEGTLCTTQSCNNDNPSERLDTVEVTGSEDSGDEKIHEWSTFSGLQQSWRLDPCLPNATSANKIAMMSAVGVVGAALTVAIPFAVLGAVEAIGVTATEIGLGITAEALAGAGVGAVAAAGALGTTAKIVDNKMKDEQNNTMNGSPSDQLQSQSVIHPASRSLEDHACKNCRPISSWRTWSSS